MIEGILAVVPEAAVLLYAVPMLPDGRRSPVNRKQPRGILFG